MSVKEKVKNMLIWGFILWLVGYLTSCVLYFLVPKEFIGWIITPLATFLTVWVLLKKVKRPELTCYFGTGLVWTIMAIVLDYVFLVRMFRAGSTYYNPNVFLYYFLTFTLPIIVGYWKFKHKSPKAKLF
jgi:hypothetical protein